MRQFFVEKIPEVGEVVDLSREDQRHLQRVLRAREGDELRIVAQGRAFLAAVAEEGVRIESTLPDLPPKGRLHLALGLVKGTTLDAIIQHGTEVGVDEFHLLNLRYSVANFQGKEDKKVEKLQKVAEEAAKQSNRLEIPTIHPPVGLTEFLAQMADQMPLIFCNEREKSRPILKALEGNLSPEVALLVGPEGGFHPQEAEEILAAGAISVDLGPHILRAETAALVAAFTLRRSLEREEE
ncbi:MAG: RsmE family RNA methyltransferase [Tissierellia bacterium]|nr:RsmE family RNA methyltransferase [Tissierellia bacterium]